MPKISFLPSLLTGPPQRIHCRSMLKESLSTGRAPFADVVPAAELVLSPPYGHIWGSRCELLPVLLRSLGKKVQYGS